MSAASISDVVGLEGNRRPPVGGQEPRSPQVAVAPPVADVDTASVQLGADADGLAAEADRHAGADEGDLAGDGAQPEVPYREADRAGG